MVLFNALTPFHHQRIKKGLAITMSCVCEGRGRGGMNGCPSLCIGLLMDAVMWGSEEGLGFYDTLEQQMLGEPICVSTLSSHCRGPLRCSSIQQGVLVTVCLLQERIRESDRLAQPLSLLTCLSVSLSWAG